MAKNSSAKKAKDKPHADHSEDILRLRRIRGQVEGVERMIEDGRYCPDIVNQIRSVSAALKSTETLIVERHIRHCIRDAIEANNPRLTEEKVNELVALFSKR